MDYDPALPTYIAEARELLESMEDNLLNLEHSDETPELLNAIFRAAHTIKGSAGLFGLDEIVNFTHGVESLLDKLRENRSRLSPELINVLLRCRDHISNLVDHVEQEQDALDDYTRNTGALLTEQIHRFGVATQNPLTQTPLSVQAAADQPAVQRMGGDGTGKDNWHISLRFGADSLRNGMEPMSFLRYLGTLGKITYIDTIADTLPSIATMNAETCYLGFEISFHSEADKQTIDSVFDFIRDDSWVRILPPHSRVADYIDLIKALPEENLCVGEILVRCGALTATELDEALNIQTEQRAQAVNTPLGKIVVESGMTPLPVLEAAIEKQAQVREGKSRDNQSIRVDADKLDKLINLIGEMVIAGAGTALHAQALGDSALLESISTLTRLVEEVRDSALRLRMVQIGATFNRFQRVVHDVSSELGKDIDLVITGAETELDKTVIEKIGDPLMHLVRNAIDHGIEPAAVRLAKGKPAMGTLRLNACHDSGSILIEVSDDGAGLSRDRILKKAIEKGLVREGEHVEDHDIYNLIFEPGFSTADGVTNLSGRGVGMDVVKRNINALRGTVELETYPGEGSVFRVRMPLTLAIIDGFLVKVDSSSFVVPLDMVLECVELNDTHRADSLERNYINLRGEVLPFIRIRQMFGLGGQAPRRENVVVVNHGGSKVGLVVDQLMGEFQTVIKPLGNLFNQVHGISGSTILGNGEVALILDVPGLVHQATAKLSRQISSAA